MFVSTKKNTWYINSWNSPLPEPGCWGRLGFEEPGRSGAIHSSPKKNKTTSNNLTWAKTLMFKKILYTDITIRLLYTEVTIDKFPNFKRRVYWKPTPKTTWSATIDKHTGNSTSSEPISMEELGLITIRKSPLPIPHLASMELHLQYLQLRHRWNWT